MKKVALLILFAIAGCSESGYAQQTEVITSDKKGWHKIGETTVNFQKDRDEVMVVGADRFAALKFKVTDAPINLMYLEVYYESGDMENVQIKMSIKSPGESKALDLNGGERNLKKIVFVYKTLSNTKDVKAHVEIWGLKTNTDKK